MSHSGRLFRALLLAVIILCCSSLFAVSVIPAYTEYPCLTPSSPANNCQTQAGNPLFHAQARLSERSPNSTCNPQPDPFGGFCDGGSCTSTAGYCRQPSLVAPVTANVVGTPGAWKVQFDVQYDFPNSYCQVDFGNCDATCSSWPVIFNDGHRTRLRVLNEAQTTILAESFAVFERGQWRPLINAGSCGGTTTYKIQVLTACVPELSAIQTLVVTVPGPACEYDKSVCTIGGDSPAAGSAPPIVAGLPVNIGSGDVSYSEPLFTIEQSPTPLQFVLSYHSERYANPALVASPLSAGWTHSFAQTLRPSISGRLISTM